eukprot:4272680-Prymnesium_polylepis.1
MQSAPHWLWEHRSPHQLACTARRFPGWWHLSTSPPCTAEVRRRHAGSRSRARMACIRLPPS